MIKQEGLYQNKVNSSLGWLHNCKMAYSVNETVPILGVDSGRSRQGALGGPRLPLTFRPNWGSKGPKLLGGDRFPPYLRVWMTGPPLYLKVWIRHCSKPVVLRIEGEAMLLLVLILPLYLRFSCRCSSFNPSLCHLFMPLLLSYVAVSRPCCLLEFYPRRASFIFCKYYNKM